MAADVGGHLGVGHAGLLEPQHVEVLAEPLPPTFGGAGPGARNRRHAQPHDRTDAVRVQQRGVPHHHRAPVVADEHGLLGADVVEQTDEVAGQGVDVVVLDGVGAAGAAVPPLVWGQHAVAGLREHRNLMSPGVGKFGESVGQHEHGRFAFACLDHPQPHTVGLD